MGHDCHPNPFRTRRLALRRAWLIADEGKDVEPYECEGCGLWHLRAVEPKET